MSAQAASRLVMASTSGIQGKASISHLACCSGVATCKAEARSQPSAGIGSLCALLSVSILRDNPAWPAANAAALCRQR